jgi:SAM-dependent methyltransferase
MPITVLTGLPGSGKSKRLIETVGAAAGEGRRVETLVSSAYPWPSEHGAFWVHRRIVCGQPGLTCRIDHFVSTEEAASLLATIPAETLVAVEEAYAFGSAAVDDWQRASERGVEVLVAAPSGDQLRLLTAVDHSRIDLELPCQHCRSQRAEEATVVANGNGTSSLCADCFRMLAHRAEGEIADLLRAEHPYPGEEVLYQPVELPAFREWRLARWDTIGRADAMNRVLTERGIGVFGESSGPQLTYLDVGCNTGLFCDYFARRGYVAKGIDATDRFITSARLLESFYRRKSRPNQQWVRYELANAYEYLRDTRDELFDVTSAFAVFQWLMIQRSPEHGLQCLEWLSQKTKKACFVEMGYSREEMYKDRLNVIIDREWVLNAMKERGNFSEVQVINAVPGMLQRDLFAGLKNGRESH